MRVIYKKLPSKRIDCVATIGVFDGIHLGHRFILEKLKRLARDKNIPSLIITFDTPPQIILQNKKPNSKKNFQGLLVDFEDKKNIISKLGINYLWFLKTTKSFLKFSGHDFINYIYKYFRLKHIIVGRDFRFGYKGHSGINYLKKISKKYGFKVTVIKKMHKDRKTISSSLIRHLIENADFKKIENFLSRNYYLKGKVVKGSGYGKRLGFPTANIDYGNYVIAKGGVYAAVIKIGKLKYLCAVNIGVRPTINKSSEKVLEAYIINFNKNIVGKKIKLRFIEKIRDEKKFRSKKSLINAIRKDILYIKKHCSVQSL